jgi:hypothetical protein
MSRQQIDSLFSHELLDPLAITQKVYAKNQVRQNNRHETITHCSSILTFAIAITRANLARAHAKRAGATSATSE